jgi:nickel/cobalt exporter
MLPRLSAIAMFAIVMFLSAAGASAHPLGNFTINHLTKLSVGRDAVHVHYVLDMAEIPTFQALGAPIAPQSQARRVDAYAKTLAPALLPELQLDLDGARTPLVLDDTHASTRPGAGQLPTLYVVIDAHVAMPSAHGTIAFHDDTFAGRLGWHDIIVAPATEPTHELTAYPNALIGSPRATTAVEIVRDPQGHVAIHATTASQAAANGVPAPSQLRSNQLSDMLARGTSDWGFVALTFLVAIVLGALHALEPGHGKTLLAISLVGARATVKQATILATALTVAHTIGVLALGVAINLFKGYFVPETIYPWITLISGIVIAVIGARAVQRQMRMRNASTALAQGHALTMPHTHDHEHGHEHGHDHDHNHANLDDLAHARAHAIPGNAPLTFGGTVWAAMSGGVAPCPAALVVLLAAVALNQVAYGIFVIVAFSFGLAATLTGLGIAVVRGATWLQGRPQFERFVTVGPLVSAIVIATIGAIMVGQGFAQRGVSFSPLLVSAVVALAIAAFAFIRSPVRHQAEAT